MDKVRDVLFDAQVSLALSELETGPKSIKHMANVSDMDPGVLAERLKYVVECGFLQCDDDNMYTANPEKLEEILSSDGQFDSVVDGITEMDSYLN